jgi:hypothetical protein
MVSILVVVVISALPVTAKRAFAKHGHPGGSAADEAQVRELLAKLAAASGVPEPEERTDADLMYDAMLRWNGEPAGSAAVDRLIDSSKKEAARSKKATQDKVRKMFWKDPFADDPQKLVLVRQEDRDLIDQFQRRNTRRAEARAPRERDSRETELSRLRHELAAARAEAEEARAEAERMREHGDTTSQRQGCVADASTSSEPRKRRRASSGSFHTRNAEKASQQIALASTAPADSYTPPPPPVSMPPAPVPAHGIIVTPLPSPPPPPPPAVEARRHGRSH